MPHNLVKSQLDSIAFNGVDQRPRRDLIARTNSFALRLNLRGLVTVVDGGADGALTNEQPDTLLPTVRIFDGDRSPIYEVSAAELRQFAQRSDYGQAAPGVPLAIAGAQVATAFRRSYVIPFANRRRLNPIETCLRPRDERNFYLELEWPSTNAAANGPLATALITGGADSTTVSALTVDIVQEHDPVSFADGIKPLYVPRMRRYEQAVPATSPRFPFLIKSGADAISRSLIHTLDNGVTVENALNLITLRDDRNFLRESIRARDWHEAELAKYSALENATGAAMGYFGEDFANNGKLGTLLRPYQGGNLRWEFDLVGAAQRIVRVVNEEYDRVDGLTTDPDKTPAVLLD